MNRIIPSACIALACAVTLGAQSAGTQYPSEQPQSQKMSSSDKTVSLTGCLREGDAPGTYVLTDLDASALRELGAGTTGTSGTTPSGTSGMAASGSKDVKVQLSPEASVNLKDHVGQQVSVTGMLAKDAGTGATGTTGAPGAAAGDKDAHKLNVRSIKMVSSTCASPKM